MRIVLGKLTYGVALALRDDQLRNRLFEDLQASRFPEHKLHLRSYLGDRGKTLFDGIARKTARSYESVLASLDSTVDVEIYLPVNESPRLFRRLGYVSATSVA